MNHDLLQSSIAANCFRFHYKYPETTNFITSSSDELLDEDVYIFISSDPYLLLEKCDGFFRMYYFINCDLSNRDWLALQSVLDNYSCVVSEYITKDSNSITLELYNQLGFSDYCSYIRMSMINKGTLYSPIKDVRYVREEDIDQVIDLLNDVFDPKCDRIPTREELSDLVRDSSVLGSFNNDELCGVLIFEDNGTRSYVRGVCVSAKYRGMGYGESLMDEYLNVHAKSSIRLFYLWVNSKRSAAERLYHKLGYQADLVTNHIYIREGKPEL